MQKPKQNRLVLGVTGSFGSGKSTVARIFCELGATVIDADKIAHRFLKPRTLTYKKIIRVFGKGILADNNTIDRKILSEAAFRNKRLLKKLNKTIHPEVIRMIKGRLRKIKSGIIVIDAPLLIEAGLHRSVDKVIVVKADTARQIKRLKKSSFDRKEALRRIQFQIPLRAKARLADFIIDNSGSLKETRKQVGEIRRKLWKS